MNLRIPLRMAVFLFFAAASPFAAQTTQDAAWDQVIGQQRQAFRILDQEQAATGLRRQQLYRQRVEAFRLAASRLTDYKASFIRDSASVSAVNAEFQTGFYLEFAAWDREALVHYYACRSHPKLQDAAAVFG